MFIFGEHQGILVVDLSGVGEKVEGSGLVEEIVPDGLRHGYSAVVLEVSGEVESVQVAEDIDEVGYELVFSVNFAVGVLQVAICDGVVGPDFHPFCKIKVLVVEPTRLIFIFQQNPLRIEGAEAHKYQHLFRIHLRRVPQLVYFQRANCRFALQHPVGATALVTCVCYVLPLTWPLHYCLRLYYTIQVF